jgi:SAM-dependent methyltransferase
MSEERRAAPAPSKVEAAVEAPDLDGEGAPARPGKRDSSPAARRRARMALRIPDDEVARPTTDSTPPPPVRALSRPVTPTPDPPMVAVTPMRIISVESDLPPVPAEEFDPVTIPVDERSPSKPPGPTIEWTASTLAIEDGDDVEVVSHLQIDGAVPESEPPAAVDSSEEPTLPALPSEPSTPRALATDLTTPSVEATEDVLTSAVTVEDLAAVADETGEDLTALAEQTGENLAAVAEETSEELAAIAEETAAELAAADEAEDVRFEEDTPTPALPRVEASPPPDTDRRSDPGDVPEVSAEDMVAVEAAPAPARAPVDLPPMRPRTPSHNSLSPLPQPPAAAKSIPVLPSRPPLVIVPPHVGSMAPQTSESIGPRRKGRLWWEDLFNDDYLRTMEKVTDAQIDREVDFIETSLGLERGGTMLDLACGTGRQAIELARRGYEVVAFDLSLQMLARAGDEAQERDVKLNFVQGDMRDMTFEAQFDGVYCWNTAFGYFDEEKNAHVVDRVHRALKTGGLFLLDVVNRDFILRQSPSLAWFEGDGCVCMDEMTVDFITSRMKVKRTLMMDDGRTRETEYSLRIYSLHELGKILHEHGFKVTEVSGRVATPGVFFGNESPRTIILAEKR